MGHDGEKGRPAAVMVLKLCVGMRQLFSPLCNALLKMLSELGEIRVGLGIVNGGGHVAGDREQDMKVIISTGLQASITNQVPKDLPMALERDGDERLHAGALHQLTQWRVHTWTEGFNIMDQERFSVQEKLGRDPPVVDDRYVDSADRLRDLRRNSDDLGEGGAVPIRMVKEDRHPEKSEVVDEQGEDRVEQLVHVEHVGVRDGRAGLMRRRQLPELPLDGIEVDGDGAIAIMQGLSHHVERMGQFADFVGRGDRERNRRLGPFRNLPGRVGEASQGCRNA